MLGIDLNGFAPPQSHPGAPIELIGNGVELFLGKAAQVSALGEVLAQEPIGVLVGASLPGAVGVTEVHLHAGVLCQLAVLGHLAAPVVGQALAHRLGYCLELVAEGLQYMGSGGRVGMGQPYQQHQAGGALDQRSYGAGIAFALDSPP